MKKLLPALMLLLASCAKEQQPIPGNYYEVTCRYCLVYVEDDVWNRYNDQERSKAQHFNVSGTWRYNFTSDKLDTASLRVYVGPVASPQRVQATISGKVSIDKVMGFETVIDTVIKLPLK